MNQSNRQTIAPETALLQREIESLVAELRALAPDLHGEDITPASLMHLFNASVGQHIRSQQLDFFIELEDNLQGSTFADFTDPDVLRGLAILTYYSIQAQVAVLREPLDAAVRRTPSLATLRELRADLAGLSLQDWLEPKNWLGMWQVATYGALLKTLELYGGKKRGC